MIYGYCRVSSKGQQRYGTSLEEQKRQILNTYPGAKITLEAYSGAKERPLFDELIGRLQRGDTLVVCKLDRFARSVQHGLTYINELMGRGVKVHILNMGLVEDTPMGRLIVTNLLAFAEFERATILERTAAGREAAQAADPNWKAGRKCKVIPDEIIKRVLSGELSQRQAAKEAGVSYSTFRQKFSEIKKTAA